MATSGPFKTDFGAPVQPSDPESLFRDLKGRQPEIRHLWSHQADVLRLYHEKYENSKDIAIELPTGAGKTLVALLIAEYRRLKLDERVAYLCPTRQLAWQVGGQASAYGIRAHVLVGKQTEYPATAFAEYAQATSIAVTTYSSLFNVNPRINDPHVLILDDAHAGENYISNMWSVEFRRDDHEEIITGIGDIFADVLPDAFAARLQSDDVAPYERTMVDLVPSMFVRERAEALRGLIESQLEPTEPAAYSWRTVQDHLHAMNLFISWRHALLRPISPPTLTHLPFRQVHQRLYMSATLGAGGELERITGIGAIERLPAPAGWEKRGSGRRLFLFPELSLSSDEAQLLSVGALRTANRALVLTPDMSTASEARGVFAAGGVGVLGAGDIEDTLSPFTEADNVALVLANRYDGLDLPDDACRLVILWNLPSGVNLQESFLLTRLAATELLRDRILTRLVQASGRCTRSDRDYAVALILGAKLQEFVLKTDNRGLLNPETQAEIEFGVSNSTGRSSSQLMELLQTFLRQGEEWIHAEEAIKTLREQKARREDQTGHALRSVVANEIDYLYALWRSDFREGLEKARTVSDALGGEHMRGYRGWWYYLAGEAALMLHERTGDSNLSRVARDFFARASQCSVSISWFAELSHMRFEARPAEEADLLTPMNAEALASRLVELGSVGDRFEKTMVALMANLSSDDHGEFQRGLKMLGEVLGYEARIPGQSADPDCVWSVDGLLHITHEVKTEESAEGSIGANDLRQAKGHADWVRAKLPVGAQAQILCCIETPRNHIARDAMPHAGEVMRVDPSTLRKIGEEASSILRRLRVTYADMEDAAFLDRIVESLAGARLGPRDIMARLSETPARSLEVL